MHRILFSEFPRKDQSRIRNSRDSRSSTLYHSPSPLFAVLDFLQLFSGVRPYQHLHPRLLCIGRNKRTSTALRNLHSYHHHPSSPPIDVYYRLALLCRLVSSLELETVSCYPSSTVDSIRTQGKLDYLLQGSPRTHHLPLGPRLAFGLLEAQLLRRSWWLLL